MNLTLLHSFFYLLVHYLHWFMVSAKLSPVLACELDLLYAVLLSSFALWYCTDVPVTPEKVCFELGIFCERWAVLMSHLMLRTSKVFLETCFHFYNPLTVLFSPWFTPSWSHLSVRCCTFSFSCCCRLICFSDSSAVAVFSVNSYYLVKVTHPHFPRSSSTCGQTK